MRIFVGFLLAALALGGAVWIHNAKLDPALCRGVVTGDANAEVDCGALPTNSLGRPRSGFRIEHPARKAEWQDPLAVALAVAGIGAGVALVVPMRGP